MYQSLNDLQKKRLFNSLLAVCILLAVFLGIKSLNALKENSYIGRGEYPANVISVTGTGEVLAVPDIGSFGFSVVEEGKTVKDAQDKSTKKINSVIDALKGLGIEEKDIKTDNYTFYPKYDYSVAQICTRDYCPPGKQTLTGYEVNQSVTIKIRKTADAGLVLTKVGELGVTNATGLNFVIDDEEKVQDEAREKAIIDAKEKAKVLSKSLGVRLKKIVNFQEGGNYPVMYGGMMKLDSISANAEYAPTPPQVPVGENKVVSSVTITYEVE
ncbi:MAG: SIMPL domain-containing protein [Minisyncoccia bacterium]